MAFADIRWKKEIPLYAIAWRFELDYRGLAAANAIVSPYTIYPGQLIDLTVPAFICSTGSRVEAPAEARQTQSSTPQVCTFTQRRVC